MLIRFFQNSSVQFLHHVPLRRAIIIPFVLQICATVGITGYLSWRNGQQAVLEVANQLRNEVTARVTMHLDTFLEQPHLIAKIIAQETRAGGLNFDDIQNSEYSLFQLLDLFDSVHATYMANEGGKFIYVKLNEDGSFHSQIVRQPPERRIYQLTPEGERGPQIDRDRYDPRIRPWYTKTLVLEQPNWSQIYPFTNGELGLTASRPLYDRDGQFMGIVGVDFVLGLIDNFLQSIQISPNAEIFILEPSGFLVATSTAEKPFFIDEKGGEKRLKIADSQNPKLRAIADYLHQNFEHLSQIEETYQSDFKIGRERQFIQVVPHRDQFGLNWLIVVAIPEADFMGQIDANARTTLLLCLVALAVTIAIGVLTARWVTRPLLNLNQVARKIASGQWNQTVQISRCDEVGELAETFNQMVAQLRQSFKELEAQHAETQGLNRQLLEREYWLNQFLETLPVGVLVYNKNGKISYANKTLKQLIGKAEIPEVNPGKFAEENQFYIANTNQIYPAKALPLVRALKGKSIHVENLEIRREDRTIPCSVMAAPIFDCDDAIAYGICVFEDITQRRQAERERQKFTAELQLKNEALKRLDQIKDEFLANTSHELRTPLNGMIGLAESMLAGVAGPLTEVQHKNLVMIAHSGHRLSTLVNDILDFSKLRHRTIELQQKPLGLREMVEIVVILSKPLIRHKEIRVFNEIPADLPAVYADENRLQQILYNLIGNAIKFTEAGTVKIAASVAGGDAIAVAVSDTGIGIPEDKRDRIFESFEQGDGSTARQYGGTGLGLAVTKQLVELHHGQIWVDSVLGEGSTFTFTLPISDADPPVTVEPDSVLVNPSAIVSLDAFIDRTKPAHFIPEISPKEPVNEDENQFKILIVDDDPVNLQVLANYLYLENYAVTRANNGPEALEILEAGFVPDLILMDVMMPRMTGYEVTQKIRETWPAHQLPIVMLTAKNRVSDLVFGLEVGANDYLSKPLNKDELLARIKTHIRIKQLRTEKAHIRKTFGRYVTDEVVANLLESDDRLKLGGERRTITILTSDLRGFTATSERLPPEEVVKILNFYLSKMADVITGYNGTIDEFMGDGILVLFGAPKVREDDPRRAIACAVAMQLAMDAVNRQMKAWGYPNLEMGIGVNTGEVVVGNIGSEKRTKYGVVGKHVNLAYRLESYTTGGQIFISQSTLDSAGAIAHIVGEKHVQPKGVQQPIPIYELGGVGDPYNLYLKREKEIFVPLPNPIALDYVILEGKHVGNNIFSGQIVELSAREAQVKTRSEDDNCLPLPLTNIKLNFRGYGCLQGSEDVYAKVLEREAKPGYFYIHFTAKPPEVDAELTAIYERFAEALPR
ncbi:ATP-binding protein [Lyngbya sp. CCY1209]|uniref:ATP-binding protein n=1 Tax=Lyngbya sp. CCY1209 TaxID=2886103 RepID=UPI002D1FF3D8|nr:ATP-binding protein [Lyngbya sp. CCY1209]MEB3884870.1 response regulator [Lyngbya sp. CCY1209]